MLSHKIHRRVLILLIFIIPALMVATFYSALFGLSRATQIFVEEWPIIIMQIVFFAVPFLVAALSGANRVGVWVFITVISSVFWAWFATRVIQSAERESGVDFGAVFVMLGAPVMISIAGVLMDRLTRSET